MGPPDHAVARTAAQQHGVVTWRQLQGCGLDGPAVRRRVAAGRLHRVHRGVYAVGHVGLSVEGRYLAAALAAGGVVSHRAAGHLLRLLRGTAPGPEVLVVGGHGRTIPGVLVHRTRVLGPGERGVLGVVPITSVARTLVDLAPVLGPELLMRACHEAQVLHRVTPAMVDAILEAVPNRAGTALLRRILHGDEPTVLSRLERRFLALLRETALPLPQTNRPTGAHRVDCRWPAHRLVVELDSYRWHGTRRAWEADHRRAAEARAAGLRHRRFTWGDVFERPEPMLAELRTLLS